MTEHILSKNPITDLIAKLLIFIMSILPGDVTLDLAERFFLSVDWKNNDKMAGYVLVQSKEMVR